MAETPGMQMDVRTPDNKMLVQSSPRPIGTFCCFVSEGDNTSNMHYVGGGQRILNSHNIGDSTEQTIYVDFNIIENRTYMQEGYGMWIGAEFDCLNMDIVPRVTSYTSGINTNFNMYGPLIIPAGGNGTIEPQDIQLIQIPFSMDDPSVRQSMAFWNATYNKTTQTFENITPAPNGDGEYNIFGAEVVFQRPVNLTLLGDHSINMKSNDIAIMGHNIRLKYTFKTVGIDHAWKVSITMAMHREHVSNF